jgi:hypothetical protein
MKNIFRNILLGGVALTMFASCNLDLLPSTAIPYEDGDLLILSQQDVVEWQNGVLASYRGVQYGTYYQTVEVMSECFNASVHFGNNYGFSHRLGKGFDASNGEVEGIWAGHYGAIKTYNVAIEQCEMIEDEAFFLRQMFSRVSHCTAVHLLILHLHVLSLPIMTLQQLRQNCLFRLSSSTTSMQSLPERHCRKFMIRFSQTLMRLRCFSVMQQQMVM